MQSDSSGKASSKSIMVCKPMAKAQLETEAWKPSYEEFREPSVENDYEWDYGKSTFDPEWEIGNNLELGLSSSEPKVSADYSISD